MGKSISKFSVAICQLPQTPDLCHYLVLSYYLSAVSIVLLKWVPKCISITKVTRAEILEILANLVHQNFHGKTLQKKLVFYLGDENKNLLKLKYEYWIIDYCPCSFPQDVPILVTQRFQHQQGNCIVALGPHILYKSHLLQTGKILSGYYICLHYIATNIYEGDLLYKSLPRFVLFLLTCNIDSHCF